MSWPVRVKTPWRVISRRVVTVYVEASQFRNGHTANTRISSPATTQPPLTKIPSVTLVSQAARPSATTRINNGSSNALAWVRVLKTTLSPSFRSRFEIATGTSCHSGQRAGRVGHAEVDHVPGAQRTGPAACHADHQPALVIDVLGAPLDCPAPGPLDPHVAPERLALRTVRRPQPG